MSPMLCFAAETAGLDSIVARRACILVAEALSTALCCRPHLPDVGLAISVAVRMHLYIHSFLFRIGE